MFQSLGFSALASTSTGYAWTTGRPDYKVGLKDVLEHLTAICEATNLPLNADFESGFASDLEGVAENIQAAIRTGVAGVSIEDRIYKARSGLYDLETAVKRVRAAREAIDKSGEDVILIARTEGLLDDPTGLKPAIAKLVAFAEAGADCLYAPGVGTKADIQAMVKAVSPKSLNVLVMGPGLTIAELADLGVRRISVGGALALVGWDATLKAAAKLKAGDLTGLIGMRPNAELNETFAKFI
jgi:2-methylisocitrate lyase-like PEP mutase family enzyme